VNSSRTSDDDAMLIDPLPTDMNAAEASGMFDRNGLMQAFHAAGIATGRGIMGFARRAALARLPASEAAAECLQLPIHSGMGEAETERVLAVLEQT
jgi:dTDP-4-amino-4,6-dideoxygalactose transaminase